MKTSFRRTSDLQWLNQDKLVANMMHQLILFESDGSEMLL